MATCTVPAAITTKARRASAMLRNGVLLLGALLMGQAARGQKPFAYNDTTFVVRDFRQGYHAVFYAAPHDSVWYARIASPPGDMRRHGHVQKQMRMLHELGIRPVPVGIDAPPRDYVGAVLFDDRFQLYAPSDWAQHRQQQLHGAWLITNEPDGPLAHAIVGRPPLAEGELLHLRCVSMVSHALDPKADTVEVRAWRIDEAVGVELWEHRDSYGDARYELMVPLDRARALPVLVNHAPGRKVREVEVVQPGPRLLER